MKKLTIGKQIAVGFTVVWLTLMTTVLVTIYKVRILNEMSEYTVHHRIPTAEGTLQMISHLQGSLAALRGWMILDDNQFKVKRETIWREDIDGTIGRLNALSQDWTNPENIKRLELVRQKLPQLRDWQQKISDIAHTDGNRPALHMLRTDGAPAAAVIAEKLQAMITIEAEQPVAAERRELLIHLFALQRTTDMLLDSAHRHLTADETQLLASRMDALWKSNTQAFTAVQQHIPLFTEEQKSNFAKLSDARTTLESVLRKVTELGSGAKRNTANYWLATEAAPIALELNQTLMAMLENQKELRENDLVIGTTMSRQLERTEWLLLIVGMALSITAGAFISYSFKTALVNPINEVIGGLTDGSDQVAAAASQVAESSQRMAEGSSEQASGLEEVSSSLEELTSMTRQNSDNAKQANGMVGEIRSGAEGAADAMTRMSDAMKRIRESADQTGSIVKTIDEIAFQTNLLALNAAVEAARAGDAGRGFAVVAEEVRNLAQRSAEAARNTGKLIDDSRSNAENGVAVSKDVGEMLLQIGERVKQMAQLMGEVVAASTEQAQGIEQINTAVAEMDKVTQSNAANSEESASASEELSAKAQELNGLISLLTEALSSVVGNNGVAAGGHVSATPGQPSNGRVQRGRLHQAMTTEQYHHRTIPRNGERTAVAAGDQRARNGQPKPQSVIHLDDDDLKEF